jgi:hypothetical protein
VAGAALPLASGTVGNPSAKYRLVAEYVWDGAAYSTLNAWFNPTSSTQTTPDVVSPGGTLTSLNFVYFREGAPALNAVFNADSLAIGRTWNDVVAAVPEPSSLALAVLGAAGLKEFETSIIDDAQGTPPRSRSRPPSVRSIPSTMAR